MNIASLPFDKSNMYENPFKGKVSKVGYKTYRMKRIKVLKADQYIIVKNVVNITDANISMGTGDKIFIEVCT